jgi:hypothetical protein
MILFIHLLFLMMHLAANRMNLRPASSYLIRPLHSANPLQLLPKLITADSMRAGTHVKYSACGIIQKILGSAGSVRRPLDYSSTWVRPLS